RRAAVGGNEVGQKEKGVFRKTVLRLPDLDQAKSTVLNSLSSIDAQRRYRHAIDEFIEWYCSEPRLSFSKTLVLRYRIHVDRLNSPPAQHPSPSLCRYGRRTRAFANLF